MRERMMRDISFGISLSVSSSFTFSFENQHPGSEKFEGRETSERERERISVCQEPIFTFELYSCRFTPLKKIGKRSKDPNTKDRTLKWGKKTLFLKRREKEERKMERKVSRQFYVIFLFALRVMNMFKWNSMLLNRVFQQHRSLLHSLSLSSYLFLSNFLHFQNFSLCSASNMNKQTREQEHDDPVLACSTGIPITQFFQYKNKNLYQWKAIERSRHREK